MMQLFKIYLVQDYLDDHVYQHSHFNLGKEITNISASKFKEKWLVLMDKIAAKGETLVVTKKGIPILEMNPYSGKRVNSTFGLHLDLEIH